MWDIFIQDTAKMKNSFKKSDTNSYQHYLGCPPNVSIVSGKQTTKISNTADNYLYNSQFVWE